MESFHGDPRHMTGNSTRAIALRSFVTAALAVQLEGLEETLALAPEFEYLREVSSWADLDPPNWYSSLEAYLRDPHPSDAPLLQLSEPLGLSVLEILAVTMAATVEEDLLIGRVLARMQAPVGGSRPTLGLLGATLGWASGRQRRPIEILLGGPALRSGLLQFVPDAAPLAERAVWVSAPLCLALHGQDGDWPGAAIGPGHAPVPLPPSVVAMATRYAGALERPGAALVVRTGSTAEGRAAAAAIAHAMKRRPVFLDHEERQGLGPWLRLRRLLPVWLLDPAPGEQARLSAVAGYDGPLVALCGPDGGVEVEDGTPPSWHIPVPPPQERRQLWQIALKNSALAVELGERHRHSSGRIAHLGQLARQEAALHGREHATLEDIGAAAWTAEGAGLDTLAQPIRARVPHDALVMTPSLERDLRALQLRCQTRELLAEGLGVSIAARYDTGVRALFTGPSGTGKTLAAAWLATQLGLPLYRVDLAAVTSKYIGETEKNLARLMAQAEGAEVMLLFDEADALFGKRTDVRDANDRFANAQTNYLLQRIEAFDGIAILTSNSRGRFDAAFSRRLDSVIEFPLPGPEERLSLWISHLGPQHALERRDLNRLAATADLAGGNIRNVVLAAAVQARDAGRPIQYGDIEQGLVGEYRKLERHMPAELKTRA